MKKSDDKISVKRRVVKNIHSLLPLLGMESFLEYIQTGKKIHDISFFLGFISYVLEVLDFPLYLPKSGVLNDDDVQEGYSMSKKEVGNNKVPVDEKDFKEIERLVNLINNDFKRLVRNSDSLKTKDDAVSDKKDMLDISK